MIVSANAIAVRSVVGHLLLGPVRCWKDFASRASSFSASSGFFRMAVRCKRLCRCSDWMSARWLLGVIEPDSSVNACEPPVVQQGQLSLTHVQADEMRVKGKKGIFWMGLAMEVSSRLWLAGVLQTSRDHVGRGSPAPTNTSLRLWSQSASYLR